MHFKSSFVLVLGVLAAACEPAPRDLTELSVVDSAYVEPSTGEAYSGAVFKRFVDDPDRFELEGELLLGVWEGELVVYHPNGRVRYMGSFSQGQRCGPWTENADSVPTQSVYEDLVREVETMGIYPPCEG